jgi:steroid 5-alpha reductase family enzyme
MAGLLVTIWGVRLAVHFFLRNRGKGEDFRYISWREEAGSAWWTIFSPLLMTFLLHCISGVAMMERSLRKTKPSYAAYMESTNAFFPGRPKDSGSTEIENEVPA